MTAQEKTIFIYTTFPDEAEARRIGAHLVEARLAACVNIFPGMISIYAWEGKIENAAEIAMIIKTRASLRDAVFDEVSRLHSYTVPALLAFEAEKVAESYAVWLLEQTSKP
jgi:periplasmic divalent cation tolerance protein